MKIAVASDERYSIHSFIVEELKRYGHEVVLFGALKSDQEEPWVQVAREASESISSGLCQEGIFFCWTGTGISIVANKHSGIRAALCTDAETALGARIWNHANVLVLSNRLIGENVAKEILKAWFSSYDRLRGAKAVEELKIFENYL